MSSKPEIDFQDGPAPAELVIEDIIVGDGTEAKPGGQVTVHYVGVEYDTGEQFDASWDRGEPIEFPLQGVITGWQEGLVGATEGSRVLLVIPPDKGYGEQGSPPVIGPNETLVFVVDVEKVAS